KKLRCSPPAASTVPTSRWRCCGAASRSWLTASSISATWKQPRLPKYRTTKSNMSVKDQPRGYRDLHEHIAALEERGLLRRIERPIDKDAEMHPLVRWQFVG